MYDKKVYISKANMYLIFRQWETIFYHEESDKAYLLDLCEYELPDISIFKSE
jgi:hypothetical protein